MPSGVYKRTKKHKRKLSLALEGKPGRVLGKHWKLSNETKNKMSLARKGDKNPKWKGDKVGYSGLHTWVKKHFGKADHCAHCGLDKIPKDKKRYFHWANKSHKYLRNLTDW